MASALASVQGGGIWVRYRVDSVPRAWRPVWWAYSWLAGLSWWAVFLLLHSTCRLSLEGTEKLEGRDSFIYSLWHESWPLWFVTFARSQRRHAWLQHPAAYMKPAHILLERMGIRILLGSGGDEGRRAAARLVRLLGEGWSTAISPDGPSGPARTLKKGVLHIALDSGVPVVPVWFEAAPIIRLPSWDRKILPLPFARIRVVFGEPLSVTRENFAAAAELLVRGMDGVASQAGSGVPASPTRGADLQPR